MTLSSLLSTRRLTLTAVAVAVLTFALLGPAGVLRPAHARAETNCEDGGECGGDGGGGGGGDTGGGGGDDGGGGGGIDTGSGGETGNGGDQSGDNGDPGNGDDTGDPGNGGETGDPGIGDGGGTGDPGTGIGDDGGLGGGDTGLGGGIGDDGGLGGGDTGFGGGIGIGQGSADDPNQLGFGQLGDGDAPNTQDPEIIQVTGTTPDPGRPVDPPATCSSAQGRAQMADGDFGCIGRPPVVPPLPPRPTWREKQAGKFKDCLTTVAADIHQPGDRNELAKKQRAKVEACAMATPVQGDDACYVMRNIYLPLHTRYWSLVNKLIKGGWSKAEIDDFLSAFGATLDALYGELHDDCEMPQYD